MHRPLPTLVLAALLLGLLLALAGPRLTALTQTEVAPRPFEPVSLDDYPVGELVEGDGPVERLAPDVRLAAPRQEGGDAEIPAPRGYALGFDHYPRPDQIVDFLRQLEEDYPDLVEVWQIGESWQGRPILAARVANERLPGLEGRPQMYTDGQHHARELISSSVPLYTLWWLVDRYGKDPLASYLVDTRNSYFVPSVNVDGSQIVLNDNQDWRKTANPTCCDDDQDGAIDEDAPVGYGYGTQSVVAYEFDQAWADQNPTDPFQPGWRDRLVGQPAFLGYATGALGGEVRSIEAIDQDGDGETWEDPIGGTDSNRNYDWFWEEGSQDPRSETFRGPQVWSEPQTRTIRDFVEELDHLATGIAYHSGVDVILHPWGYDNLVELGDAAWFELMGRKGSELTEVNGYRGSSHTWTARGLYGAYGSTMDWLYGTQGVYAFSPEVYGGSNRVGIVRQGETGVFHVGSSVGFGFNPPPDEILPAVDRWRRNAVYVLATTPNVELNALEVAGEELALTLGNDGLLPVRLEITLDGADGSPVTIADPITLTAGSATWRVPLAELARERNALRVAATLDVATVPHVVETAAWTFSLTEEGQVRLEEGELQPFVDLGAYLDGWGPADEKFAGDEYYQCRTGPCDRLPVPAFPSATPGPSQTPRPPRPLDGPTPEPRATRTPWSVDDPPWLDPTPTAEGAEPTATLTPGTRESAIYLPWAWR